MKKILLLLLPLALAAPVLAQETPDEQAPIEETEAEAVEGVKGEEAVEEEPSHKAGFERRPRFGGPNAPDVLAADQRPLRRAGSEPLGFAGRGGRRRERPLPADDPVGRDRGGRRRPGRH